MGVMGVLVLSISLTALTQSGLWEGQKSGQSEMHKSYFLNKSKERTRTQVLPSTQNTEWAAPALLTTTMLPSSQWKPLGFSNNVTVTHLLISLPGCGSQSWLHMKIACTAFSNSWPPTATTQNSNLTGLGLSPGPGIFKKLPNDSNMGQGWESMVYTDASNKFLLLSRLDLLHVMHRGKTLVI